MKFAYSQLPTIKSKTVLAPVVPVTFCYGNKELSTFALVDSGAAGALISTVIAENLEIDWGNIPVTNGFTVSGSFRAHVVKNVEAIIEDRDEKVNFSLDVNVVEGISPYHCILGQKDLFQKAKITFESYNKQFEIIFRELN